MKKPTIRKLNKKVQKQRKEEKNTNNGKFQFLRKERKILTHNLKTQETPVINKLERK